MPLLICPAENDSYDDYRDPPASKLRQAAELQLQAQKCGQECEVHKIANAPHGFMTGAFRNQAMGYTLAMLAGYLGQPMAPHQC